MIKIDVEKFKTVTMIVLKLGHFPAIFIFPDHPKAPKPPTNSPTATTAHIKPLLIDVIFHQHMFLMIQGDFTFRFLVLILFRVYLLYLLYVYVYNTVLCCV